MNQTKRDRENKGFGANDSTEQLGEVRSSAGTTVWILMIMEGREGPKQTNEKRQNQWKWKRICWSLLSCVCKDSLCFEFTIQNSCPTDGAFASSLRVAGQAVRSDVPPCWCQHVAPTSPLRPTATPILHLAPPRTCVSVACEPYRQIMDAPVPRLPRGAA